MAPDIVVDGVNGFLADVGSVDRLVAAVERLHADVGLRTRIGTAARETAERYAWPRIAAEYERLYRAVKPAR